MGEVTLTSIWRIAVALFTAPLGIHFDLEFVFPLFSLDLSTQLPACSTLFIEYISIIHITLI